MNRTSEATVGRRRLAAMMFFQVFTFGAYSPILSMYLQRVLHFSSARTGVIMALSVVSSIVSPILSVYVVDRRIRAKRLYILCHAALAASAVGLSAARGFGTFLSLYLVNALLSGPTMGMLNAISFQSLHDREGSGRNYGAIRVWGTVGWMAAGYLVSGLWAVLPPLFPDRLAESLQSSAFLVSGAGSVLCVALAVGLPAGRLEVEPAKGFFPREAVAALMNRSVLALSAVFLASSILDKLFYFGAAPYLSALGFAQAWIPTIMTLGQVSEIAFLAVLGPLLARSSYKPVLLIGASAQVARFFLLRTGVGALGLAGMALHGVVFACLYSTALMYIDRRAAAGSRQAVHQLIQLLITGTAALAGNLLAGALGGAAGAGIDFGSFWLVALAGAALCLAVLALGFHEERADHAGGKRP